MEAFDDPFELCRAFTTNFDYCDMAIGVDRSNDPHLGHYRIGRLKRVSYLLVLQAAAHQIHITQVLYLVKGFYKWL